MIASLWSVAGYLLVFHILNALAVVAIILPLLWYERRKLAKAGYFRSVMP